MTTGQMVQNLNLEESGINTDSIVISYYFIRLVKKDEKYLYLLCMGENKKKLNNITQVTRTRR
jgi:hypothetical protein